MAGNQHEAIFEGCSTWNRNEMTSTLVAETPVDSTQITTQDSASALEASFVEYIGDELEMLNVCADVINSLEVQLETARDAFQRAHRAAVTTLTELGRRIGRARINKCRRFFELEKQTEYLQQELRTDSLRVSQIALRRLAGSVGDREVEQLEDRRRATQAALELLVSEKRKVWWTLGGWQIHTCRPYYENRAAFQIALEERKSLVSRLEAEVTMKKCDYAAALRRLEALSESTHAKRATVAKEPSFLLTRDSSSL